MMMFAISWSNVGFLLIQRRFIGGFRGLGSRSESGLTIITEKAHNYAKTIGEMNCNFRPEDVIRYVEKFLNFKRG